MKTETIIVWIIDMPRGQNTMVELTLSFSPSQQSAINTTHIHQIFIKYGFVIHTRWPWPDTADAEIDFPTVFWPNSWNRFFFISIQYAWYLLGFGSCELNWNESGKKWSILFMRNIELSVSCQVISQSLHDFFSIISIGTICCTRIDAFVKFSMGRLSQEILEIYAN